MYGLEDGSGFYDEVVPNCFQEPRSAVAPFLVIKQYSSDDNFLEYWDGPHDTRAEAEERARQYASDDPEKNIYFVYGAVSISSCPPPVKASTRALV